MVKCADVADAVMAEYKPLHYSLLVKYELNHSWFIVCTEHQGEFIASESLLFCFLVSLVVWRCVKVLEIGPTYRVVHNQYVEEQIFNLQQF